jgi:AraC-like DNA-binding protein
MRRRCSIRFPGLLDQSSRPRGLYRFCREEDGSLPDPGLASAALDAPPRLAEQMADLVRFKTATLTAFGYQRNGVWGEETASQKVEHLGLMFGALAASPSGAVHGFACRWRKRGRTAKQYVARWRMLLACDRLENGGDPVGVVALAVGYESESAFSTAFKRMMGCSPRHYGRTAPAAARAAE